jgi:hypothetical protein
VQTKKLLGSTLALGMFFSGSSASAVELFKNLKLGGQMDWQAISAHNVTDFASRPNSDGTEPNNDRIGDAQTRIMIHADFDMNDDVHAKVSATKNDRTWGTQGGTGRTTNSQPLASDGGASILDTIFIDQAFVKVDKIGGHVDATLGRQFYGESGDMVVYFGPSDKMQYGLPVTAIDAARADWSGDWGGLTGIAGKIAGHAVGVAAPTVDNVGDKDLRGLVAMFKGTDMLSGSAYVYNQITHGTGGAGVDPDDTADNQGGVNDRLWIVGVKGKATMGMAWLAAEFAKNFGTNRTGTGASEPLVSRRYNGWAVKLDAGAKAELGFGAVAPWAHLAYGTGDDNSRGNQNNGFTAIAGDYRPGTIYGTFSSGAPAEFADGSPIAGNGTLTNRIIGGVGVKTTPSSWNKLTVGLGLWDFRTQTSGSPENAEPQFSGNRHIGSEVDLDVNWAHSENVTFGAGLARFWAGGLIQDAIQSTNPGSSSASANSGIGVSTVNMAYASARIKFGGQ